MVEIKFTYKYNELLKIALESLKRIRVERSTNTTSHGRRLESSYDYYMRKIGGKYTDPPSTSHKTTTVPAPAPAPFTKVVTKPLSAAPIASITKPTAAPKVWRPILNKPEEKGAEKFKEVVDKGGVPIQSLRRYNATGVSYDRFMKGHTDLATNISHRLHFYMYNVSIIFPTSFLISLLIFLSPQG